MTLVVGVNGTGKTTTVAKLAKRRQEAGSSVILAAADTFRAIAERIVDDIAPPSNPDEIDMAGCSARLFDSVNEAFAKIDAQP